MFLKVSCQRFLSLSRSNQLKQPPLVGRLLLPLHQKQSRYRLTVAVNLCLVVERSLKRYSEAQRQSTKA
jgi:hypothetical protein